MTTEYLNNRAFESIIGKFQKTKRERARYELIAEDLTDTVYRKSKRADASDNEECLKATLMFRTVSQQHSDSKDELAIAFRTLAENIVRYAKFNLIDFDDAIQEGVMICFEKIDRFDPNKGKAFNYLTTCILNHFRQLYRTARNYNELKRKYLKFLQSIDSQLIIKNGKEVINWN